MLVPIETIRRSVPPLKTLFPKLKEDILKNGMKNPLILQNNSNMICTTGNNRLAVLKSLDIKEVPVIFLFPLPSISKKDLIKAQLRPNQDLKNARHISGKERLRKKRKKKNK